MPETASARQSSRVSALLRGILPEFLSFKRDSKVERNLRYVLFTQYNLPLVLAQDLDPERKALQLLHQHSERLRDAGLERVVALDDRLVCLHAADDVVRLDGQDLLQNVGGAVRLERPNLHLSEPLAAELRLAAERVQNDVDGCAVRQVRHVLRRHDPGDDALVAVAAGHLVAGRDLSLLGDVDPDHLVDSGTELVLVLAGEDLDVDHDSALAMRYAQARVAHLARLLTEDRTEQALLSRQLGLALGRDLAHQDVALLDLGADVDDAALVEVAQRVVRHVGDVARDLLGAELGLASL